MLQSQALNILKTGANVFLTGEPGAGKTHTVNEYVEYLRAREIEPAITAATGIAATHIGGTTVHSWSGIGIREKLDNSDLNNIADNKYVRKRLKNTNVLIVDEVSMLSADTLDMVDAVCRRIRQDQRPFGGLQVVLVGDFFQLPPIVKNDRTLEAQAKLLNEQHSAFAYNSSAWARADLNICYITEQYRQDDKDFLDLLTAIRRNNFDDSHLSLIIKRVTKTPDIPSDVTKLYSHNVNVDRMNETMLSRLDGKSRIFEMTGNGRGTLTEVLQRSCLSPDILSLKVGATVMFTKNNLREGFANGTLGQVIGFDEEIGYPIVKTRQGKNIVVEPMDWLMEENGKIIAQITQVPLRLAWAITIHKSQGMSMDAAVMDLSGVFEFGQGYVALSRVRRLSGLYLLGWNAKVFQVHPEILEKDALFRSDSLEVLKKFSELSDEEVFQRHQSFVVACDGRVVEKKENEPNSDKAYDVLKIRNQHPNAYRSWDDSQDEKLRELFKKQISIKDIAESLGRKIGAIRSRLKKIGETGEF